ncbi:TetR/AcrR family transcriptional regulator [Nocardia sp. CA2R105]|uniref:TetR/AcrR family transcriptional regulator n=1 Tax=Nocardia coffeae TaxID=2873381 RepID=UPI001CA73F55|nr:TetR/AcrR family transcriptional regulator [Nocardia coffeae]MBY8863962.1 TetR/AcrR family transcriptional regulator [Nocardia coffeae]
MVNESTRLSARDWAQAALKAIADGGLAAVAVEPLARTLGVTKGSFYAHYRNRDELIEAALAEWVRTHGEGGLAEFAAITDPAQRLRDLVTAVVQAVQPLAPSVHLSLLGDRGDPRVRAAVAQVNRVRLDLLTRTYRELGLPAERAEYRARIAYAAILGLQHLAQTEPDSSSATVLSDEAAAIFLPS